MALVLDRSGSMAAARKFADRPRGRCARAAMLPRQADRFALVVFDSQMDVLVAGTDATPARGAARWHARQRRAARLHGSLRGSMRGAEQLAERLRRQRIARALLLTDGLANAGTTNHRRSSGMRASCASAASPPYLRCRRGLRRAAAARPGARGGRQLLFPREPRRKSPTCLEQAGRSAGSRDAARHAARAACRPGRAGRAAQPASVTSSRRRRPRTARGARRPGGPGRSWKRWCRAALRASARSGRGDGRAGGAGRGRRAGGAGRVRFASGRMPTAP